VFESTCLPLLEPVLRNDNHNALLFAYGVSNSGKTYSILGSSQQGNAGILPRALAVVFRSIETYVQDSGEASQYRPVGFQGVEKVFSPLADLPQGEMMDDEGPHDDLEAIKSMESDLADFADKFNIPLDSVDMQDLLEEGSSKTVKHGTVHFLNAIISIYEGVCVLRSMNVDTCFLREPLCSMIQSWSCPREWITQFGCRAPKSITRRYSIS